MQSLASQRSSQIASCSSSTRQSAVIRPWRCSRPHVVAEAHATKTPVVPQAAGSDGSAKSGRGGQLTRKLVLLRHAESESANTSQVRDHDRPLSERGRTESALIAKKLLALGWTPDLVLASNSKRTKQTLDEMAVVLERLEEVDTHLYGSLYTVAALDGQTRQHLQECLLEVVNDSNVYCVFCVGHNKGWEEAASSFAGQAVKLRTASAALLQCAADSWADALQDSCAWQLVDVVSPTAAAPAS